MSHRPLVFALDVELSHPSSEDRVADAERLKEALRISGLSSVFILLRLLRRLPDELRRNNFSLTVVIGHDDRGFRVLDINRSKIYGIALDIGTTTLECDINIESAVNIGMLPDIQRDKIVLTGNSSLKGASMILLDSSTIKEIEQIQSLITYREMSEDADLLNVLQGSLFIPHTDPEMLRGQDKLYSCFSICRK